MILLFMAQCLRKGLHSERGCCWVGVDEIADEENLGNLQNALIQGRHDARETEASDNADELNDTVALCCAFCCVGTAIIGLAIILF
jgi:hypothetical protein